MGKEPMQTESPDKRKPRKRSKRAPMSPVRLWIAGLGPEPKKDQTPTLKEIQQARRDKKSQG